MNKKNKYQIFAGIIGSIILGVLSFGYFVGYGGSRCNMSYHSSPGNPNNLIQVGSCDCFCCEGLYGQGYESCGMFGLYSGLLLGALIGVLLLNLIWKMKFDKKQLNIPRNTKYILLIVFIVVFVLSLYAIKIKKNTDLDNFETPQNENLTLNNFGNDQIEKAISNYLLTQKHFSWKNRDDSHNFCAIDNLKPDKELFPLYVWAYCGEYVIENNKLKTISGSSGPVKIDYPNELSYYDTGKFSYEAPGDGSNYSKDIKTIFPEDVQEKIFKHDVEDLIEKAENYAFARISNWNDIKKGIADCEIESVMQTHALEVTATYKDGREVKAQEPEIDDIFDIINQYKDICGEVIMATE